MKPVIIPKQTLIKKFQEGIYGNNWDILHHFSDGTWSSAVQPLVDYLERKGVEITGKGKTE